MSPPGQLPRIPLILVAAMCLAGAEIGHLVIASVGSIGLPALWPPTGVLAALLILNDRRRWKTLVPTACGAMLLSSAVLHGRPVLFSIGYSAIACLEACLAASIIQRRTSAPFRLNRLAHASALVVATTLASMAGAVLGAGLLGLTGGSAFTPAWRAWWLAEALGMLLAAPLVIAAATERGALARTARSWKGLEVAVVFVGSIAVAASIFGEGLNPLFRVPAYLLPFLLWPVFRFGPGGAAAVMFVVSVIGLWNAGQGLGPFAVGVPAANLILRSQGSLGIAAVSFFLLASIVAERKRVAQEYAALVAELQQALAEIKTLRGLIPICAWCHKIRDDAGFWQQIEMYLDARTDATFSHSICPGCAQLAQDEIEEHDVPGRVS